MTLSIIAAMGRDGSIGRAGDLAFHIRADLRHFKDLTMGHPVIMGRKTFESLPKGALPGRRNIVVTTDTSYTAPDIETASSLQGALAMVATAPKAFIIGGASIYRQALPLADVLNLTIIDADCPEADTFFPPWNEAEWTLESATPAATDPATGLEYCFTDYRRL